MRGERCARGEVCVLVLMALVHASTPMAIPMARRMDMVPRAPEATVASLLQVLLYLHALVKSLAMDTVCVMMLPTNAPATKAGWAGIARSASVLVEKTGGATLQLTTKHMISILSAVTWASVTIVSASVCVERAFMARPVRAWLAVVVSPPLAISTGGA